jgi:hypothetical protein
MNQAVQAKDKKKFDELAQKLPELEKNLGPEYLGLVESLGKANLTPKDGQEIVSIFDKLDESCPALTRLLRTSIADEMQEEHRRRVLGE